MSRHIALATSGTLNAKSAELFAFGYCLKNNVDELMVIHVSDTSLTHYGEVDQLASGTCKDDFINYINDTAKETSKNLYERLEQNANEFGVSLQWVLATGKVIEQIQIAVDDKDISTLIIGTGEKPQTFFSPRKTIARVLAKKIKNCTIIPVSTFGET